MTPCVSGPEGLAAGPEALQEEVLMRSTERGSGDAESIPLPDLGQGGPTGVFIS